MDIGTGSGVLSDHDTASIAFHLEREFDDAQKVDFDVFVEALLGHSPDIINRWTCKIQEQNWLQDSKILASLKKFCAATSETGRYGPLSTLITRMTELSRGSLPGVPETYPIDDICVVRNDPVCVQTIPEHGPLGAQRKPDLVMIRAREAKLLERTAGSKTPAPGIKWSHDISSWESKFKDVLTERLEALLQDRNKNAGPEDEKTNTILDSLTTRRKRTSEDGLEDAGRKPSLPQASSSTTIKPCRVREGCKDARVQLGSYALETLACTYGTRLFCVNVLMDDDRIHLWYYDACGLVRTGQSISLIDDFEKAAALIVGFASCPPERLGALPSFIQPPISTPYPASWPPENLKDHTLSLDRGVGESGISITLKDPVFTQYSLTGRRTFVYNVEPNSDIFDGDMIAKLSYQISTRPREQDLVKVARKAGVEHLPQIHFSGDLFKMSDGVRRIFFEQGGIEYEDRTLRMIVYSRYFPLQSLIPKRPECLREMVVQIVNCLYDLKEKASILHRDISVNNIMYELREGEPYFILIDYDMAIMLSSQDDEPRKHSRYREGTLPFMAADLVQNLATVGRKHTPHYLRHDLESLFWLSLWSASALISPTNQEEIQAKELNVAIIRAWETREFKQIAQVKQTIRRMPLNESEITLIGKATCLRPWFRAWSNFWWTIDISLMQAIHARSDAEEIGLPPPTFDWETVNGLFTRNSLLSALRAGQKEHAPSHLHNGSPPRDTALISHVFSHGNQPLRRSTRATTAKTAAKEPQTARGSRSLGTTRATVRKASTRKIERARGKSPPTSPSGRKKTSNAATKAAAAKVAKKTMVRKATAAKKGTTRAARTATTSDKDAPVPLKDAPKSNKKRVTSQTSENEAIGTEGSGTKGANTLRRGKASNAPQEAPSTHTTTKRTRTSAKKASTKPVQAEAKATKKASTKKATSRKKATRNEVKDEDKEGGKEVIETQPVERDENDIRRRLRPRKRT